MKVLSDKMIRKLVEKVKVFIRRRDVSSRTLFKHIVKYKKSHIDNRTYREIFKDFR